VTLVGDNIDKMKSQPPDKKKSQKYPKHIVVNFDKENEDFSKGRLKIILFRYQ